MGFTGIYKQKTPSNTSIIYSGCFLLCPTLPDQANIHTIQTFILIFLPPSDTCPVSFSQMAIKHKHFLIQCLPLISCPKPPNPRMWGGCDFVWVFFTASQVAYPSLFCFSASSVQTTASVQAVEG